MLDETKLLPPATEPVFKAVAGVLLSIECAENGMVLLSITCYEDDKGACPRLNIVKRLSWSCLRVTEMCLQYVVLRIETDIQ